MIFFLIQILIYDILLIIFFLIQILNLNIIFIKTKNIKKIHNIIVLKRFRINLILRLIKYNYMIYDKIFLQYIIILFSILPQDTYFKHNCITFLYFSFISQNLYTNIILFEQ